MVGYKLIFFRVLSLILLSVAIAMRLYNLQNFPGAIFEDVGRELLVAKYVAHGEASLLVSPLSSWNKWPHAPGYYWFIGLLFSVLQKPVNVLFFFGLAGSFSVVLAYLIGRSKSILAGLAVLLLFSINHMLVYLHTHIAHSFIVASTTIVSIYFFHLGFEKKRVIYVLFSNVSYFFALFIHNSSLFILPAYIVSSFLFVLLLSYEKKIRNIILLVVLYVVLLSKYFVFTFLINNINPVQTVLSLFQSNQTHTTSVAQKLFESYGLLTQQLFEKHTVFTSLLIAMIVSAFLVKLISDWKHREFSFYSFMALLLLSYPFTAFVPLAWSGQFFVPFFPIYLLAGGLLVSLYQHRWWRLVTASLIVIAFMQSLNVDTMRRDFYKRILPFADNYKIARVILSDNQQYDEGTGFTIQTIFGTNEEGLLNLNHWFSAGIWYALEEISGQSLVKIVPSTKSGNNIAPVADESSAIYLVCNEYPNDAVYNNELCLDSFHVTYRDYEGDLISIITADETGSYFGKYFVYRFKRQSAL